LQKIQNDYRNKGAIVVMVNTDFERYKVGPFLKKNPATATVVMSDGKTESNYNLQGIPLNFVIDRNGVIRFRKVGFGSGGEDQFRAIIDALLAETSVSSKTGDK
jgi:hypothetical protein